MNLRHTAALVAIGWYLLLITVHYFNQRPLWNDEYCVFQNIVGRPLAQVFSHPLSHDQGFPKVYLYAIGQFGAVFNHHVLALRFLPFLSMVVAFFIWVYLAKQQVNSQMGRLTFILCWCASVPLIYYAAELKQYSMDVLAASLFFLFLYHQQDLRQKYRGFRYALVLIGLTCTGLLSYPALFLMFLPLVNLWADAREVAADKKFFWLYFLGCVLCFAVVFWIDLRVSKPQLLMVYWKDYFISLDSPLDFLRTFQESINNLISRWFAEQPKWIRAAARLFVGGGFVWMFFAGIKSLRKKSFRFKEIKDIGLVVLGLLILASVLKKYPFSVPRLSLFFAPVLLFCTVHGLQWIRQKNKAVYIVVQGIFLVYLSYVSLGIAQIVFAGDLGAQPVIWR